MKNFKRRDLVKLCGAASVAFNVGPAGAVLRERKLSSSIDDLKLEKSIKAGFGGGFSMHSYVQSNGYTYADIGHRGNRYLVASTDLLDWKIMSSSMSL